MRSKVKIFFTTACLVAAWLPNGRRAHRPRGRDADGSAIQVALLDFMGVWGQGRERFFVATQGATGRAESDRTWTRIRGNVDTVSSQRGQLGRLLGVMSAMLGRVSTMVGAVSAIVGQVAVSCPV